MNQYKVEFKETFKKEILVNAESKEEALDIIEEAYLKTNMLDISYKDLESVETKIVGENGKDYKENSPKREVVLDENDIEYLEEIVDEMQDILNEIEEICDKNDSENEQD